ncbi:hypothetical protein BH09VER1_BH09VER1_08920 [soil metagenome]
MIKYLLILFFLTILSLHAEEMAAGNAIFQQLIKAQMAKDYEAFVADGTLELKAALSKTQFEAASDLMSKRCAVGYDLTPLGELKQKGYEIYLYRLRFKDGSDDMLGTLTLKDGKVAGIYFK